MIILKGTFSDARGAIVLLVVIQVLMAIKIGVHTGILADPDVYMWLTRAQQLHDNFNWFDHHIARVNPPYGYEQHWTRPFDFLLLSGAWLGSVFTDFNTALYSWGVVISPVLEILALLSLLWSFKPLLKNEENEVLGILFIGQLGIVAAFVAGRADHQSLLMLLYILTLGCSLRILLYRFSRRLCFTTSLISAFAIWISIESVLFTIVIVFSLGMFWLKGEKGISRKIFYYLLPLFPLLALFRLIEYGPTRFAEPSFDQISIVYVYLFGLISFFWALVYSNERTLDDEHKRGVRLSLAFLGSLSTVVLTEICFPGFLSGPWGSIDGLFRDLYLNSILELQPVISIPPTPPSTWYIQIARYGAWLGITLPGIPVLLYLIWNSTGQSRKAWAFMMISLLVYFPLALKEIRWVPYVTILMLPGYAWLIARIMNRISNRAPNGITGMLRMLVLATSVIIFIIPSTIFSDDQVHEEYDKCPIKPISHFLNSMDRQNNQSRQLLAFTDFGPELIYRTSHSVFSIPSHRYHSGFTDSYKIMTALDDGTAMQIIKKRKVDLILVCSSLHEKRFYSRDDGESSFHLRISNGSIPDWMGEITLPPELTTLFKLFRIDIPDSV